MSSSPEPQEQSPPSAATSSAPLSPPRKRLRSSSTMIGESNSGPQAGASSEGAKKKQGKNNAKMRLKMANANDSENSDDGAAGSSNGEYEGGEFTEQMLGKPASRPELSAVDKEVVRLIGQHLTNIGLKTSADVLMHEAGCRLDQPSAATFKRHVMNGDWVMAVKTLDELKDHLEDPENLVEMKYLLLEQKYLELLAKNSRLEALKVLQTELTPLNHNQSRTHELSSYLMFSKMEDISNFVTRPKGNASRSDVMDRLQSYLPASIMLPPRRLLTLLNQAAEHQTERCLYHIKSGLADLDPSYLSVDHQCSKQSFPCETIQILTDHMEEVMFCRFSPDGLKLATGSKDMSVMIWDFDPETLQLKHSRTLERHSHVVCYFAWSPCSTRLAVCGPEDSDEVCLWNVEKGEIEGKISHSSEDSLTSVSWSPDGQKICTGGNRGNFYQCDTKGVVQESWEGVRVQCLQYRSDSKTVMAADTHHRIRAYDFENLSDSSVIQEDRGIMSFTIDDSDRYALLNIANQGMHLWDINERCLVRKYTGVSQGFYTIYSCFGGGPEQNFIASGSEDKKVYLYHVKREIPIAVLSGHTRTVNCVTWNPVYPSVLVSVSDDRTVRVWGPSKEYRTNQRDSAGSHMNGSSGSNHNATNGMS